MITATSSAIRHIKLLLSDYSEETLLRISIIGGKCAGLAYKLDFTEEATPADKIVEQEGIKFLIDAKSALFLKGLVLDYNGGLNGTGFSFFNPNATKSCGCGTSFSV